MNKIVTNYKKILSEIDLSRNKFKLPLGQPKLVAVSKTFPKEKIQQLINHGHLIFGENKVQEASIKWKDLKLENKDKQIELHLIGPLQSNKVNQAMEIFDVIQTLDREKIALRIKNYLEVNDDNPEKKFLVQVNIGEEEQKSGIKAEEASKFVEWCLKDLKLNILGLMCIPPFNKDSEFYFEKLRKLCDSLNLEDASMGMSDDFKVAIKHRATFIRIGSGIFGSRINK